jgi:thiamine kinase-like enzyme
VAKQFARDAPVLLGPARQFALLQTLAAAELAPAPLGFDAESRLLVTEFIGNAAAVPPAELRQRSRVREVAGLLLRLHAVPAELPPFTPETYALDYLERLGGRASLSRPDRLRFDELRELASHPIPGQACVCHNDLIADNVLFGSGTRLIDFDYAVMAPAVVDLASLAFMNGFGRAEAETLLDAYFEGGRRLALEEFATVQRLLRLLAHFWSLVPGKPAAAVVARYRIEDD